MSILLPYELVPLARKLGVRLPPIKEEELDRKWSAWHRASGAALHVEQDPANWWSDNYFRQPQKNSGEQIDVLYSFWRHRPDNHLLLLHNGATKLAVVSTDFPGLLITLKKAIIESLHALATSTVQVGWWLFSDDRPAQDFPEEVARTQKHIAELEADFMDHVKTMTEWYLSPGLDDFNRINTELSSELPKLSAAISKS